MAKRKAGHDEVDAIRQVSLALDPLGPEERGRVLRWAAERFGTSLPQGNHSRQKERIREDIPGEEPQDAGEFYAQATPATEPERALVVAYWVQEVKGDGEFDAQSVNTQLKQLGHGVSNITRALDDLKRRKPQLVIQIQKSGKSKQARKRYKVTAAGKTEVGRMLSGKLEK
jgi:hypothetical protein